MDYYEQFYINKFDKLDEMDNFFFEIHKLERSLEKK